MKIYKLLTLILITSFISSSKSADASTSPYKSGVYAGFSLGYSKMKGENKTTTIVPVLIPTRNSSDSKSHNGIGGDVFLGYRYISLQGYLAGLDLALSWDNNKLRYNTNVIPGGTQTDLKTPVKFIPGITLGHTFLNKFLAFIKLGASITQFRGAHSYNFAGVTTSQNFSKRKVGFYSSINLEYALNEQLSAITSASYEYYGKVNKSIGNFLNPSIGEESKVSIKPRYLTAKIGLVFRFS